MIRAGSWVELVVDVVTGAGAHRAFLPYRWRVARTEPRTLRLEDHLGNVLYVERRQVIETPGKKREASP